jgi:hypothetical protein
MKKVGANFSCVKKLTVSGAMLYLKKGFLVCKEMGMNN